MNLINMTVIAESNAVPLKPSNAICLRFTDYAMVSGKVFSPTAHHAFVAIQSSYSYRPQTIECLFKLCSG
jgi:hypothetical protein